MLAEERYSSILAALEHHKVIRTAELAKSLGVSSETIRKDLEYMDGQGLLSRVHGGAIPKGHSPEIVTSGYIPLQIRNSQNLDQKTAIARKASEFLQEGQVVALDYGSTSQIMSMVLRERFTRLTVITNSIQNALILTENPGITIILTGGILNREEYTLTNSFSSMVETFHIDVMLMTVTGIDPVIGCTDQRLNELQIQNQLHECSSKTIVLADSSKFGKASLLKICPLDEVDFIITDRGLAPDMEAQMKKAGAQLVLA